MQAADGIRDAGDERDLRNRNSEVALVDRRGRGPLQLTERHRRDVRVEARVAGRVFDGESAVEADRIRGARGDGRWQTRNSRRRSLDVIDDAGGRTKLRQRCTPA